MVATQECSTLIQFLQTDLSIPEPSIQLALRYCQQDSSLLPLVLWQYGLITLADLNTVWHWLEQD